MNVQSVSNSESWINCVSKWTLSSQKLLTFFERMMAASNQSQADLTFDTALDHVSYCRVCLDHAQPKSRCPHISNLQTFICIRNRHMHNRPSIPKSNGPLGRHRERDRTPFLPNRSLENRKTCSTEKSENRPSWRLQYVVRSGPHRDVRQ